MRLRINPTPNQNSERNHRRSRQHHLELRQRPELPTRTQIMTNPNFSSILDEAPTEVDRPKPLPVGTYTCVVGGQPTYDKSSRKGTPFVMFTLRPTAAEADVDEEELAEMGGFDNKTIRATFYLTEDAAYRLDEFHVHCGLDLADESSRRQRNDEVVNAQVRAVVKHRSSDDGTQIYAELARTLPAD